MATIGADLYNMADWAAEHNPDGSIGVMIEALSQKNDIYEDIVWRECNQVSAHTIPVQQGLPSPTWFGYNEGITPSKATAGSETFECGMVGSRSHINKALADLGGNPKQVRGNQSTGHMMAIKQGVVETLFYGDPVANPTTDLKKFPGFHFYFKDLASQNVITGTGSDTDLTSIYLCAWGENLYGIYPKGSPMGLKHEDLGVIDDYSNGATSPMRVYADLFQQHAGLAVADYRYAARICNLDTSAIRANTSSIRDNVMKFMIEAYHTIPSFDNTKPAWYVNRFMASQLHIAAVDKVAGSTLTIEEVGGRPLVRFLGIPVRTADKLRITETAIS